MRAARGRDAPLVGRAPAGDGPVDDDDEDRAERRRQEVAPEADGGAHAEEAQQEVADDGADDAMMMLVNRPWSQRVNFSASQPASAPMMSAMKKPTPGC